MTPPKIEPFKPKAKGNPAEEKKAELVSRAYALRYDPDKPPPPDEVVMALGDVPIASRGNLTVIQGKSKVGKSAVVSAIIGAAHRGTHSAQGDTIGFEWSGTDSGAIVHFDTEQSPSDWYSLVGRSVTRSGLPQASERLVSFPIVPFSRAERMTILRGVLERENKTQGGIDAVILDGIADVCLSPNDEAEALLLVSEVMALSHTFNAPFFCILHENPGTDQGKTRGHLGSELNRKAFANLRIDKDTETSVSTIWGTDMRKRDIPREQGFCFEWDDAVHMHTFQGRAAGLKAAKKEAEQKAKEWEYFTPLFDSIGTNGACPDCTPDEMREAHRDIIGTENAPSRDALKKRMQRAETLGVLGKASRGRWTLKPSGQSGHGRDN